MKNKNLIEKNLKIYLNCLCFSLAASHTYADSVIPIGSTNGLYGMATVSGQVDIARVDPITGAMISVVATGASAIAIGTTAFDHSTSRFFFLSRNAAGQAELYIVNLLQGTVSHKTLSPYVVAPVLAFDALTETLYGGWFNSGQLEITSIDPMTGLMIPVINSGATSLVQGTVTFDSNSGRLFFECKNSTAQYGLCVVNVRQGTASYTPLSASITSPLLEFDTSTNTLYGASLDSGQVEISSIDPMTGLMTPIVATGTSSVLQGSSTFDPSTGRFFFETENSANQAELYVVNLPQGTVSHMPLSEPLVVQNLEFSSHPPLTKFTVLYNNGFE